MSTDLLTRMMTAFVFLAVMITGIFYSINSLFLLFLLINILAIWEYQTLIDLYPVNNHPLPFEEKMIITTVSGIIYTVVGGACLGLISIQNVAWVLPIVSFLFIKELFSGAPNPFIRLSLNLTGILYLTLPLALVNGIANYGDEFTPVRILGILLLISVNDTGAYFAGRQFGKTKLFERVSPKKTWEGSIGGAIAVFIVMYLVDNILGGFTSTEWLGIAIIAIIFGGIGDLIESLLKRSLGVKDSGNILPGHGGILDRFDAFIFAIPFIFSFLYLW